MHFAVIDHKANRVVGVAVGNDVVEAARAIDQKLGLLGRSYEMRGGNTAGEHDAHPIEYWMFDASPDLVIDDPDRPGLVDAMRGLTLKAVVLVTPAETEGAATEADTADTE